MVGIIFVGVKNIFPLMKWGNIFNLIIDSFSSLMTLHLIFSSIGLKFFVYLLGASTDTHCFKTMVCENNS
jgi:hypothetical protein